MNEIKNKVAESGLITIDLADYYPKGERVFFDVKPLLVEELLLREKDFRAFVKEHDWTSYSGKFVAVGCTSDAIIPVWAYMLLTSVLEPHARLVVMGTLDDLERQLMLDAISKFDPDKYRGQRIVIKGCGDIEIPPAAFVELTRLLRPVVKSLMYGEPCSTVPVYKAQ
jgi:hypothetical protein